MAILIDVNQWEPVHAMVRWTAGGRVVGGTGMAIRLARHYRTPILNLVGMDVRQAMDRLDRIAQARNPRDVEQELVVSGDSPDAIPSLTPARSQHDKRDENWWMAEGVQQARNEEPRKMTRRHSLHL